MLDVELMGSSLEENGTAELESIEEVELTVEVKNDSYKTVAKPVVTARGNSSGKDATRSPIFG